MPETAYVIVSFARNEEDYIERTIKCVISQTIRPLEWIIVDDGSSDRTADIAQSYASQHPWIQVVRLPDRGRRDRGAGAVAAFYEGYECLDHRGYDFMAILDVDLSFDAIYFEELFRRFAASPSLGIAGGAVYNLRNGRWFIEKAPLDMVWGATKVYRRVCFERIGGLVRSLGWDSIDTLKAQHLGWQTRTFTNLVVLHHRPIGGRSGGITAGLEKGKADYFMGSHPLYALARGVYRMGRDKPLIIAGLGILLGYFDSWIKREPRVDDPGLIAFLHRRQLRRFFPYIQVDMKRVP
jgi:biofilm PGA synthesis N-glycosyltransferase PgaC